MGMVHPGLLGVVRPVARLLTPHGDGSLERIRRRNAGRDGLLTPHGDGSHSKRTRNLLSKDLLTPHGDGSHEFPVSEEGVAPLLTPHGDGSPSASRARRSRRRAPNPSWGWFTRLTLPDVGVQHRS